MPVLAVGGRFYAQARCSLSGFQHCRRPILKKAAYSIQSPAQSVEAVECPPHVLRLAESIEKLSLLETAALVRMLKTRLNLPDVNFSPGIAPVAMQQVPGMPSSAADPTPPPNEALKQTEFKVVLQKVDPASKAKVIREIKSILTNLNLVEAKAFVESAPKLIKEKLNQADAEKLKKTLEALGAAVSIE